MAYTTLSVDPHGYADAAVKARQALAEIETAVYSARTSLSSTAHMGGNDEAGGKFAHAYDTNARTVFRGLSGSARHCRPRRPPSTPRRRHTRRQSRRMRRGCPVRVARDSLRRRRR